MPTNPTLDPWSIEQPGARLVAAVDAGLLISNAWRRQTHDGREVACALAWLSREVWNAKAAEACPAALMPEWAADLVVWMGSAVSSAARDGLMRRLGTLIDRATPAVWSRRLQARCVRIAVAEARTHVPDGDAVLPAIDAVLALLDRAIAGDEPSKEDWEAADAARSAARSAAWSAARSAAWSAAVRAAEIAVWAARNEPVWGILRRDPNRMASAMLDALEDEIAAHGRGGSE